MADKLAFTRRTVTNAGLNLDTRDYGGDGPALVMTHGLGGSQTVLRKLVPLLAPHFRVITHDTRGHGASDVGPWTLDAAVEDVAAIVESYDVPHAAVAGHSLGGMVALLYGHQHPETIGTINYDGWGPGSKQRLVGIPDAEAEAYLAMAYSGEPMTKPIALLFAFLELSTKGKARGAMRRDVVRSLSGVDFVALHESSPVPSLAFNCTGPARGLAALLMSGTGDIFSAYRASLTRDLSDAAVANPLLTVVELADSDHGLILSHAQQCADATKTFLGVNA